MSERDAGDRPAKAPGTQTGGAQGPQRNGGAVALVVSPHAGGASSGDPRRALEAAGLTVAEQIAVNTLDDRRPFGREWQARGYRAAVAAGGDGTVGAVATQLAGSALPLGILPLGTSNDVARSFDLPLDIARAAEVIARGTPVAIDTGEALPATSAPKVQDSGRFDRLLGWARRERETDVSASAYFLHALTLGFNVEFARLATDVARRERWGNLTYPTSILEAITQFKPITATFTLEGVVSLGSPSNGQTPDAGSDPFQFTTRAAQIIAVNTPVFGGQMGVRLPDVLADDAQLDFFIFDALEPPDLRALVENLLSSLVTLRDGLLGQGDASVDGANADDVAARERREEDEARRASEAAMFALPGLRRFRARSVLIETTEPLDVTLDGEIRAQTPVRVRSARQPIRLLLPTQERATTGEER